MRAMIMAAGLGTRMRPLTDTLPKPLIAVAGKPLIDHAIDRLVQARVKTIVVNVHYHAEKLKAHLAKRKDAEIVISDETGGILGTGGGVAKALPHLGKDAFFVVNSDSIWIEGAAHALERMTMRWDTQAMDALLLLAPMVTALGFEGAGDFLMDAEGHLARVPEMKLAPFAFMGVQIVHPRLFADAPKGTFTMNLLWDRAIAARRLFGVRLDGTWMHVGTQDGLAEAEAFLAGLNRGR